MGHAQQVAQKGVEGRGHASASDLLGISVKTLYTRLSLYAAAR
jgi:hypothetical protein